MTRVVLIDVDGVLVHSHFHADPERRRKWNEHLLEDMGVDPIRFTALFSGDFDPAILGQESVIAILDDFLPTVGYRGSTLDFMAYWLERDISPDFRLFEGLKRLKATSKARLYVATNQEHLRANHLWRQLRLGHLFDDMLYSARLSATKPNRAYFEAVAKWIGPQDEPPLIFDDGAKVIEAARSFGWDATLYSDAADFFDDPWVQRVLR